MSDQPVTPTDPVVVPVLAGLLFHAAREEARKAGVQLTNPEPDAPPVGPLATPGTFAITDQSPAAGTMVQRGALVRVWMSRV